MSQVVEEEKAVAASGLGLTNITSNGLACSATTRTTIDSTTRSSSSDARTWLQFENPSAESHGQSVFVNHAPAPCSTDGEASHPGPRLRKRGIRSLESLEARKMRNHTRFLIAQTQALL